MPHSYIVDPVVVDELMPIARYSGVPELQVPDQAGRKITDGTEMNHMEKAQETGNTEELTGRQTILVTGATGFLGEYLVRRLVKAYRVRALGRNRERGRQLAAYGAVFCPGDFTDRESCAAYFEGVDYVIHGGALSTVWGKWEDFYRTNVAGTNLVAGLCLEKGIRRLVYVSSPSIYTGKEDQYCIREDQAPQQNDLNYYIKSKLMAEGVVRRWNGKGLETVILRPRGLIGIGDTSLVPRLLRANQKPGIPLFREGRNLVDITSVENVALACELAMKAPGASGRVFNITNGEPMAFGRILEQFLAAIGEQPHYLRLPFGAVYAAAEGLERLYRTFGLPGEPPLTRYTVCTLGYAQTMDISQAREILGYRPEKTLAESIGEYGAWWKGVHGTGETAGAGQRNIAALAGSIRKASGGSPLKPPTKQERAEKAAGRRCAGTGTQPVRQSREAGRGKTANLQGPGKIMEVRTYRCGSCTNNLGIIFRSGISGWKKRQFPARAMLIRHRELGNILYDAGYSREIFRGGMALRIYRLLNPVQLETGETIAERLKADGIAPESVGMILLSHAHPDHVGGLSQFSGYDLVAFEETLEALHHPGVRRLMFPALVPPKGSIRREIIPENPLKEHFLCGYFEEVYDLFGDGSLVGVRLEGHSRGQMGLWIPDVSLFLAADACWGGDLVRATNRMRLLPRLLQDNFAAYEDSLRRICRMKRDHPRIRVCFTHQVWK